MSTSVRRWFPQTRLGWLALLALIAYLGAAAAGASTGRTLLGLVLAVLVLAVAVRWALRVRERLLWRLSHRLLVTYFFVAVVPIFLIAAMVVLTAYLLYGQLAGYLITTDLEARARRLVSANQVLGVTLGPHLAAPTLNSAAMAEHLPRTQQALSGEFPGVEVILLFHGQVLAAPPGASAESCILPAWAGNRFEGIILYEGRLRVHSVSRLGSQNVLCLTAPVSPALLDTVGQGLGAFRLLPPLEGRLEQLAPEPALVLEGRTFHASNSVAPATPPALPPGGRFDPQFSGLSKFSAVAWDGAASEPAEVPILISITTRPSMLHRRLFGTLGAAVTVPLALLVVFGIIFVVLEGISFVTGVSLTRSITSAVSELYAATRRIQAGDFAARVWHRRRDQLGELADSFNLMAASLERLIEESREKQRLENELEIARQVQEQLFPRETPQLATLEVFAACQPARVVSGDYYDYGLLGPGQLVFAIGDISGKGISAALLMATIQAALRSQLYAIRTAGDVLALSPAALVARLNRQLYETTSSEKFASLFCAHYNEGERTLTYSNAGHLAPAVLTSGRITRLDAGGRVVGLFGDSEYGEGRVRLEPGSLFIAFTDGFTEAENAFGEEFSANRLLAAVERHAGARPGHLAEIVLAEVHQWVAASEQADDMTLLIARAR